MKRMLGDDWLLPALDAHNRAFFTSAKLMLQACRACRAVQHPPEDLCRACGSHDVAPRASRGKGRVESAVVVHHAVHPLLKAKLPYNVVLVSIDDAPGVSLLGNVSNRAPGEVAIGDRVRVVFEEVKDPESGEKLRIPQWEVFS